MSREVHVQFSVKSVAIMKTALTNLGVSYTEQGDRLVVARNYHNIVIDTAADQISYDDMDKKRVDSIKQAYSIAFYKNEAIKEGMQLREEHHANGTVTLHVTR